MTKKEFEEIGKALLPELPGFGVTGPLLFAQPIGHTLRGIYFARSIDPRGFYAHVLVQPLFVPEKVIAFNFGWRLGGGSHLWNADVPNLNAELGSAIRREALPFLSRVKSPRDVAEVGTSLQMSGDPIVQQAIAFAFARAGDLVKAPAALDQFVELVETTGYWHGEIARARALKSQLLSDAPSAQRQLEIWEAESVRYLGLEKFR